MRPHVPCRGATSELLSKAAFPLVFAMVLVAGSSTASAQEECFPACRAGYLCHEGSCVSACNPPCAGNERCTAEAQCVPSAASTAPGGSSTSYGAEPTPAQTAAITTSSDPVLNELITERTQLRRTSHRTGGLTFFAVIGSLVGANGLSLTLAGAFLPRDSFSNVMLGTGLLVLAVGAAIMGWSIWKRRLKLRRQEAQQERLEELDREIQERDSFNRRQGPTASLVGNGFVVRW